MLLKKIKEVVIAWVVRRIVSRTNHRGQTHWLMRLLPPTRSVEIELTRIGGKRFLDMIENADKDSGSRRRKRRTGRKWHQLMQRCERASQVFGSKTQETIESKWHIKMQGANGCLSNYADDELMELKLAIIENEQSYIQELDVLYIQAKEVLRWHHILPRFNRQCITKNLQKLKINAVTIEERVTSVQHSNLETLLQAMDEILNEKFISYLLIYCENIGELRELFKQKMRKDSEFCRLLFSSYFQIERSLLPIHRISKLQTLLKEILELLSPNNHLNNSRLYNQALLLEAKLSEIVNRCHEVTRSILGSNYMNNILQALFPFDLKLPNHFEKSEIAEKNCKDLNVFVENGLKYGHSSDLKSFTEEILTSYKSLYQGSKEDLSTQNLCEDTKSRSRLKTESLKAATSTESISYDSESSEILQAIELSAVKLQLKTEDESDDHDGEMLKRIQRRQQKISVRERKCSERLAEILREEISQNLGQNADGDKCDEGLDATEFLDHNAELYGSGAVNLDASADGSGASNTFAPNADSSQGTQAWNGSGATQILGSHAGNSSTIWAGSTLSWDDSQTIESFGATTGSWRRRWNSSRFFRGTPAVRRNSWTGVSGTAPTELIEMSEMSVSAPATLCREGASNLQSLGNELLQILQTSFGCNPDEQSSETEQSSNHQSRRKATDYEDEGLRVGDSSIFYDLPQSDPSSSSLPTANTKTDEGNSLESRENSINEDKTNGKRMKLVSEVLQRTLWEETDRVIQENVLANMTKTDIALQESKFEILTSELSYLNSLNILVTVFMNCKELSSILSRSDEESLFKHIIKVKKASELFLYDLAGKWEDDIFLSGIYYEIEKHSRTSLKVYVDYCSNQVNLHRTLQRLLLEDDKFVELTNYLQRSSECFGNSLNSFLMLPMQRVTRLPLLLQTIERKLPPHSDERKECQLTLDSLHKLVHECNEAVRDAENETCIEDKYGHKKKLSLNALEPLTFTPKSSHRKWSLFNIREIKLNS